MLSEATCVDKHWCQVLIVTCIKIINNSLRWNFEFGSLLKRSNAAYFQGQRPNCHPILVFSVHQRCKKVNTRICVFYKFWRIPYHPWIINTWKSSKSWYCFHYLHWNSKFENIHREYSNIRRKSTKFISTFNLASPRSPYFPEGQSWI